MDVDNPKRTQLMIERAKSGQPKLFEERDDSVVAKSSYTMSKEGQSHTRETA